MSTTPSEAAASKLALEKVEAAKKKAAYRAVDDFFDPMKAQFVGIGSGSTIIYGVQAIKEKLEQKDPGRYIFFVSHHCSTLYKLYH